MNFTFTKVCSIHIVSDLQSIRFQARSKQLDYLIVEFRQLTLANRKSGIRKRELGIGNLESEIRNRKPKMEIESLNYPARYTDASSRKEDENQNVIREQIATCILSISLFTNKVGFNFLFHLQCFQFLPMAFCFNT